MHRDYFMKIIQKYLCIAVALSTFTLLPDQAISQKYPSLEPELVAKLNVTDEYLLADLLCYASHSYIGYPIIDIDNFIPIITHILKNNKATFISSCAKYNSHIVTLFYTILLADQAPLEKKYKITEEFGTLCSKHKDFFDAFIKHIPSKHFAYNTSQPRELLSFLLQNKNILELFLVEVKSKINTIHIKKFLILEFSRKEYPLEFFFEETKKELFKPILHLIQEQKKIKEQLNDLIQKQNTLSCSHAILTKNNFLQEVINSQSGKQLLQALQTEKNLTTKRHVCFYHAQSRHFSIVSDIANALFYALLQKKEYPDFFFMQFRPHDFTTVQKLIRKNIAQNTVISDIKKEHKKLLKGCINGEFRKPWQLSLNLFVLGNSNQPGAQTFNYLECNYNCSYPHDGIIETIFENFNIPRSIFEKYTIRIKELQEEACDIYATGRLIVFAIPKKIVNNVAYIAGHDVDQGRYDYKETPSFDNKKIKSVTKLIDFVKQGTSLKAHFPVIDELEYVLSLTPASGLNPHIGIKMFAFDGEPFNAHAAKKLKADTNDLVQALISDLHKHNLLKECRALAQEFDKLLVACA